MKIKRSPAPRLSLFYKAEGIINTKGYVRDPFRSVSNGDEIRLVLIKRKAKPIELWAGINIKMLRLRTYKKTARMGLESPRFSKEFSTLLEAL